MIKYIKKKWFRGPKKPPLYESFAFMAELLKVYQARSDNQQTAAIIFSKDRPLQLNGLLESVEHYVTGLHTIFVLFAGSTDQYLQAYRQIILKHKNIRFIAQVSFKDDLLRMLQTLEASRVFFLVDDILFIKQLNIDETLSIDLFKNVVSFRLGRSIVYSYMETKNQNVPDFSVTDSFLSWYWQDAEIDWAYPLSVDGHLFNTAEILLLFRYIDFKTPNSLEANLQKFNKLFHLLKKGQCYTEPKMINIPANTVQNEIQNMHGELHQDQLLKLWFEGYRLDWAHYANLIPNSVHMNIELQLRK